MSKANYKDLSVLIADDFSSFRSTVNSMLLDLGITDVVSVSSGEEAISKCEVKSFDVVLCDYDLGSGRSGQHVLEELRHRGFLDHSSIFIMVSAEAGRNIVMSAYDCEPDDYLMKPITGMMLQQRLRRLLAQRDVLRPVHKALDEGNCERATDLLIDLSISEGRYALVAQKLLGKVFIEQGELQKAEKLYTRALESRQLDWARLGLAKVKQLKGDLETAGDWLERIVEQNPLYLPAYDALADNWDRQGDKVSVQQTIERAVDVSPMSILRQKRLAAVADMNEDVLTALDALRTAVKLGEFSCYGNQGDNFNFVRTVAKAMEKDLSLPNDAVNEALEMLNTVQKGYSLSYEDRVQMQVLNGRIHANKGDLHLAKQCAEDLASIAEDVELCIDAQIDRLHLLFSLGEDAQAEELLQSLQELYADDQAVLERLDQFLTEPVSESNRELVAMVNREGIDLYSDGEYDNAIRCFEKARKLFPKHVGIQLNIVQSLIGKMKENPSDDVLRAECRELLALAESLLTKEHSQYGRFLRLKKRSDVFIS